MENINNATLSFSSLENIALQYGVIFGGYVRDIIAGDSPCDMDVLLTPKNRECFLNCLLASREPITIRKKGNSSSYCGTFAFSHLEVIVSGLRIDMICSNGHMSKLDFDVNGLTLTSDGLSIAHDLNFHDVLKNIHERKMKRMQHCTEQRLNKMLAKGWALI